MDAEIRIRPIKVEMSVRLGVEIRLKWDKYIVPPNNLHHATHALYWLGILCDKNQSHSLFICRKLESHSSSLTKYGNIQGCGEQLFDRVVEVLLSQLLSIGALCNEVGQELNVALLLLGALLGEELHRGQDVT